MVLTVLLSLENEVLGLGNGFAGLEQKFLMIAPAPSPVCNPLIHFQGWHCLRGFPLGGGPPQKKHLSQKVKQYHVCLFSYAVIPP